MIKCISVCLFTCMVLATTASHVQAEQATQPLDPYSSVSQIRQLSQQGKIMPMQRLLKLAMPYVHGHIIETGLELEHERLLYEIEYVDATGKVHEIYFDARNGAPVYPSHDEKSKGERVIKQGKATH